MKRALDYLRMPKLQEIFTTVTKVSHRYGRLAVLQNVFAIILPGAKKFEKLVFYKAKPKAPITYTA